MRAGAAHPSPDAPRQPQRDQPGSTPTRSALGMAPAALAPCEKCTCHLQPHPLMDLDPATTVALLETVGAALLILLGSTLGFGIAWIRARDRAARAEQLLAERRQSAELTDLSPTLAQVAADLDALAVSVERIAEAQRFQSALLARGTTQSPARSITPH